MRFHIVLPLGLVFWGASGAWAQKFSVEDYRKALWMTTRFYGAQRSGEGPNWLIMNHGSGKDFVDDADGAHSLAGGWHDCGDHVKFGQTQYYSAYAILKAFAEFPSGFADHYSPDYSGYAASGDFTWEGAKGKPNGIPDILDEVKYATDYFIQCARDDNTFYYQVGEGAKDHKKWVTSVMMATLGNADGGSPRKVYKNPAGSSMASFCSATLALMARLYEVYDADYAAKCLKHAKHAFAYAKAHPGAVGAGDGGFYGANARWEDDYVTMAVELFQTTGEQTYLDEAKSKGDQVKDHNWSLCYNNNDEFAAYNLVMAGDTKYAGRLKSMVDRYKGNVTSDGVGKTGNQWGILRYSASQAFAAALLDKVAQSDKVDPFVLKTVDYILGANSKDFSFVVGFGEKHAEHPHHRNVYLNDDNVDDGAKNSLKIPVRNRQFGMMVGGSVDPNVYNDDINSYQYSEGGIDYNAGLVAALGYILSRLDPVDPTSTLKFRRQSKGGQSGLQHGIWRLEAGEGFVDFLGRKTDGFHQAQSLFRNVE